MHILVTGSKGQLGTELKELSSLYPMYNLSYIDIDECDLTSETSIQSYFSKHHFDVVVNCAAYTAVDRAESDHEMAHAVNALAPKYLAKAASLQGAKMIHVSTDYVFSGEHYRPYKESDQASPCGAYGKTKLQGEENVLQTLPNNALVIRTAWLYSPYGQNFLKTMMRLGETKEELSVVCDQVGSPTYAKDLARAILDICQDLKTEKSEIYHYSNEGICSWYDFAKAIMEESHLSCQITPIPGSAYPTPTKRPFYSVLSKEKIKSHFKQVKVPHWRDSLKECIAKAKENVHAHA